MKKILRLTIIALIALIALTTSVSAAGTGTQADPYLVSSVDELTAALTSGGYIKVTADIDVGGFIGTKFTIAKGVSVTLDLNGYTISAKNSDPTKNTAVIENRGTLIINDNSSEKNGKITLADSDNGSGSYSTGIYTINNFGLLTINSGTIENTSDIYVPYAINTSTASEDSRVTINGGKIVAEIAAIRGIANSSTYTTEVIINNGIIKGGFSGIWLQQSNNNANKATLNVNGGTIVGDKSYAIYADVHNSDYAKAVVINITDGTIKNNSEKKGTIGFEAALTEPSDSIANAEVNFNISGGTIINENPEGSVLFGNKYPEARANAGSITGGTFSSDVSEYVDTDSLDVVEDEDGNVYVGTLHDIIVKDSKNGKVEADKKEAVKGQPVTLNVKPNEGYKLKSLTVMTVEEEKVEVKDGKFVMPDMEVEVTAEFEKIEDPTTGGEVTSEQQPAEDKKDETPKTGAFDIALYVLGAIALVSVVGTVKAKKLGKYSK